MNPNVNPKGYLTQEEIPVYCNVIDGVTEEDVEIATALIDGYLGRSFLPKRYKDRVKLRRNQRGKLTHAPVLEIEKVEATFITPFGRNKQVLATDAEKAAENIELDPENDGYFTFVGNAGLTAFVYSIVPDSLEISYKSGFEEIPARLKTACAMLACNVRQAQSFAGAKQLTSLDFQISMTDDSFFTSDIKMLLKGLIYDVPAI